MKAIVNVVCAFWLAIIAMSTQVLASPSQDWIIAQQSLDGAFQNESATGTAAQATFEAINAFYLDPAIPPSNLQAAQEFLATTIAGHTEYLARLAIAMANANASNESTIADLLNRQNRDGGFGAYTGYESDPLSTQWVLRVFGTTQTNKQVAAKAISYLLSKQNSNGGWHIDGRSSVALTAEILLTLDAYQLTSGVTAAVSAGRAFLVQQKQNDYLWGRSFESALALSALSLGANSSAEFDLSVAALKARMNDSNSSWHSDVYTTALVLQAMKRVGALGLGGSAKGNAQGQVTLASSTQAIAGAAVTVMNSSFSAVTDTNGKFLLNNLPIGPQTLIIQKEGYTPTSVAVLIEKSKTIDAGKIALGQAQSSVFINGRVFENTSQINIPAATISLNGAKVISVKSGNDGTFEFINLPLGNYNFSISANGYHAVNGTFTLAAGKNLQINQPLVSISTPLVNGPASLHGLVLNASTRIPVADAKVWIDEQFVITDAQGNFNSPLVTRGTHQLRVEGAGYVAAQYTITFPAGASGELGTLLLNTASSSQAANNLQILSTSVDSITGKAIAGAMVSVVNAGITVVTDAQGQAVLNGISELSVNVEISAPGYWTQAYQLQASAFGSIAAQFKLLPKAPTATAHSISGFVRDQDTGLPISGAAVIIDSSHQAVTDADGHYSLLNLPIQNATIKVSALNYATLQQAIELGQTPAQYSLDLKLAKNVAATRVNLVSVDAPSSVMPAANENVQVVLENLTAETQNILMFVRVMNAQGEQKALLTPTVAGTQSVSPHVELLAGQRVTLNVPWNIGQLTAGAYTLSAEAVEVGSLNRELPKGIILSRGTAETDVTGVAQFSGALHITPPLSQAGATTPITLQALINNSGNQTLPSGDYKITLAEPTSGSIFHTATATLIDPLEQNAVAELDFGSWSPSATQIGALKVSIIRTDGIAGEITGDIYIGDVAKALFTIDQSVLPEGTSSIKGAVRLTGVDTRIGTSVDPLFVLVKTAVEKGAAFTGPAAVSWDKSNSCLGCHIQAQSLAALGASAGKDVIDQSVSHYLGNEISTATRANGSLEIVKTEYARTSTLCGA
ncbi:MAG TPA: carboxypeptidase regulatory-like domain-containing protein [Cellvibrionaceae bacterium]|nr:carboxypeptidase regulatory-like domain-containing protein [Cellvibrionaceae bacterium]